MKINKSITVAILLFSSLPLLSAMKPQHLDRIRIQNNFGAMIVCECTWRNRNDSHNKMVSNITINKTHSGVAKAPFLGYGIYTVKAVPSSIASGLGVAVSEYQDSINPHGNKYFVVTADSIPTGGAKVPKAKIQGYKSENMYKIYKRRDDFNEAKKQLEIAQNEQPANNDKIYKSQEKFNKANADYTAEDRAYFTMKETLTAFKKLNDKSEIARAKKDLKSAYKSALQKQKDIKNPSKVLAREAIKVAKETALANGNVEAGAIREAGKETLSIAKKDAKIAKIAKKIDNVATSYSDDNDSYEDDSDFDN